LHHESQSDQDGGGHHREEEKDLSQKTGHLNKEAIETIANLVTEKLQARPVTSNWQFYERAVPTTANILSDSRLPENNYETEITKSDLNDVFDVKKALLKVPKQHRSDASKLLTEIEKRSPQLTFDSKGTVYIDGDSIPQSNFFIFLPLLYKKRIPKSLSGFPDFVNKLNSMGLQKFFILDKNYKTKIKLENNLAKVLQSSSDKQKAWWILK